MKLRRFYRELPVRFKRSLKHNFKRLFNLKSKSFGDLENCGYQICSDEIKSIKILLNFANKRKKGFLDKSVKSSKPFWNELIEDSKWFEYEEIKIWLKNNLHLFKIADSYLKTQSVLSNIYMMESFYKNKSLLGSRAWHKDGDDTRTLKLFIYLTDVENHEAGPLEIIPLKNEFKLFRIFPLNLRRFDDNSKLLKAINLINKMNQKISFLGKKGHSFFIDSSRLYHRGSRCSKGKSRIVFILTFVTSQPLYELDHKSWVKKWERICKYNLEIRTLLKHS